MKQARKGFDEVITLLYKAKYTDYKLTQRDYTKIIDFIVKGEYNDIQRVNRKTPSK
jgi:hypothetical protein